MQHRGRVPIRSHKWWPYVKLMIRAYGVVPIEQARDETERQELMAVARAIEATRLRRDANDRLRLIEMVFWQRSVNLMGASRRLHISEVTAQRWHGDFIKLVAKEYGLIKEPPQDGHDSGRSDVR